MILVLDRDAELVGHTREADGRMSPHQELSIVNRVGMRAIGRLRKFHELALPTLQGHPCCSKAAGRRRSGGHRPLIANQRQCEGHPGEGGFPAGWRLSYGAHHAAASSRAVGRTLTWVRVFP